MITIVLLGAGAGAGAWLAGRALFPRPTPLRTLLARPGGTGMPASVGAVLGRRRDRLGPVVVRLLEGAGVDLGRHRQALRVTGRSPERHALDKLAGALAGLLVPLALWVGLGSAGLSLPPGLAVLSAVGLAVGGFVLPDVRLGEEAERRRRAFRHALSGYLDLVNVILAGGGGLQTALHAAAAAGEGWGFALIRRALERARLTDRSPWDTFAELGAELGVPELHELAASVAIAGSHGARIRRSLAAKADTLRGHQVAETEADAEAATERMTIPVAVLLFGFLVFIAYPAVAQITGATSP